MTSPTLLRRRTRILDALSERFVTDLRVLAIRARGRNYEDILTEYTPALIDRYGDLAATFAADFYDSARLEARLGGTYRASPAAPIAEEAVETLVRWSAVPIGVGDWDEALRRLLAGGERHVRNADRDTIHDAVRNDPRPVGYARRPQADACAFCLMLASRGAVYSSEAAATQASRTRGTRAAGESYHDNCKCEPVPIFAPADVPAENARLQRLWNGTVRGQSDQLNVWRRYVDARRADGDPIF